MVRHSDSLQLVGPHGVYTSTALRADRGGGLWQWGL